MTTIVGNRAQLWTSALSPHLLSPHLDFPDKLRVEIFAENHSSRFEALKTSILPFSLLFSISLLFSFSDFPCFFFVAFPLSFPRILGVPQREKPLLFSGFPLLFFQKSKGWRVRVKTSNRDSKGL